MTWHVVVAIVVASVMFTAQAAGPSLGRATDVRITGYGSDEPRDSEDCLSFRPSLDQVRSFLETAVIITPMEEHDSYLYGSCFVRGTASIRGRSATWVIRSGGTGRIDFYAFTFLIADPKKRETSE